MYKTAKVTLVEDENTVTAKRSDYSEKKTTAILRLHVLLNTLAFFFFLFLGTFLLRDNFVTFYSNWYMNKFHRPNTSGM